MLTWLLGATFLFIQVNEYAHIGFSARDLAFGSIFYSLTGLHGAHVFVGLMLLSFATIRAFRGHFGPEEKDHLGVEVPGIYWHFVDIMWIVVFRPSTSSRRRCRRVSGSDLSLNGVKLGGMHNPLRSEADAFRWVVGSGSRRRLGDCADRC